jgi:hypothetical protein
VITSFGGPTLFLSNRNKNIMGTLLAALAAFVLSALYLLPLPTEWLPASFAPYRDFVFMALALYLVVDALLRLRRDTGDAGSTQTVAAPAPAPAPPSSPSPQVVAAREEAAQAGGALVLLSQLQEKGRFVDFLMEDITAFPDAQVAAATRVVHQGCAAVIREYFDISPVHEGKEGERVTVDATDPGRYRLSGKVTGNGPYAGVVVHRGWRTAKLALPRFTRPIDSASPNIITPIEIDVR